MTLFHLSEGGGTRSGHPWSTVAALAGRVPDEQLLRMRLAIYNARPKSAVLEIAEAVQAGRLSISKAERFNLSRLARAYRIDPAPFNSVHPISLEAIDYGFFAPCLDNQWGDAGDDIAVLAAAGATVDRRGFRAAAPSYVLPDGPLQVRALWRVARALAWPASDVSEVRLIELRQDADPIAATVAVSEALIRHGDPAPAVEVFVENDLLTQYQRAAMACAVKIWAAG
ncbi:hypothetical protein SAMN05892883_4163 [Jatrophihabitans sp. GAS493]|uniref:hypothetical protein n=1 Tax=Jatrophihabitans sp. GAS493 TaxID=1907575 RepID=UPI000BBFB7E7|nr:hypothetical protein [Jatrophihabitans sp. GAS493]SOD74968.1 hypothetical protein SAMN05892883_4163 [Jatrophihabitans sp. GAS493]